MKKKCLPVSTLPTLASVELIQHVRDELLRRPDSQLAAYCGFAILRCPDESGDWLVQPWFDVADVYAAALTEAARVVRQRFKLAPLLVEGGSND